MLINEVWRGKKILFHLNLWHSISNVDVHQADPLFSVFIFLESANKFAPKFPVSNLTQDTHV